MDALENYAKRAVEALEKERELTEEYAAQNKELQQKLTLAKDVSAAATRSEMLASDLGVV